MRLSLLVLASVLCAGCGGGGGGDGGDSGAGAGSSIADARQVCPYIHGAGVQTAFTSTCQGCTIADADLATDGVLETYATITIPTLSSGTLAFRATTASGTYPAGSRAGVVIGKSAGDSVVPGVSNSSTTTGIELRTYYMDAPAGSETSFSPNVIGGSSSSQSIDEFTSAAMYDAVEMGTTISNNTGPLEVRVFEFCAGDQ